MRISVSELPTPSSGEESAKILQLGMVRRNLQDPSPLTQRERVQHTTRVSSLTHSLTHVKHGASQSTAQCARKHLRARAALAHTQEALAKKVGIVPSLRLCCPSVVTPPGRRWPLLFESLLRYPNQVFYTCRGGYSLDRKLGNATNVISTNVRLCLPAQWMVISSIGESLRHVQWHLWQRASQLCHPCRSSACPSCPVKLRIMSAVTGTPSMATAAPSTVTHRLCSFA